MRFVPRIIPLCLLSVMVGCASVPQESVELSQQVGSGLTRQHQTQIELINVNFAYKREQLDKQLEQSINSYFKAITPQGLITLSRKNLQDVAQDILALNNRNTQAKEELEKARLLIIDQVNNNFQSLQYANSSVTQILQSAVNVDNASSDALTKLSDATGGKVDLEKLFSKVDEFVVNHGDKAGKANELLNKLETLIAKRKGE